MTSSQEEFSLPKKISRYEILRELGEGGMATVYLARDPSFQRDVAIKVLPEETKHDPVLYERFLREARTIASLEHPAIIPVYDFGEENGQPFLVMRYLSGGSLTSRIKLGPLPINEIVKILERISGALDAAHAKGIIHRDVKPANIIFDQYGEAYLSDFGIARLSEATSSITGSGAIGTPAYMSPEQIRGGEKVDGRTDIYALGIVLFEMLTGRVPFKADTPAQMMMMQLNTPTPPLPEDRKDIPEGINAVLMQATAKEPDGRFQKASELGKAISLAASGEEISASSGLKAGEFSGTFDQLATEEESDGEEEKEGSGFLEMARKNILWIGIGASVLVFGCIMGIAVLVGILTSNKPSDNSGKTTVTFPVAGKPGTSSTNTPRILSPTLTRLIDITVTVQGPHLDVAKLPGQRFTLIYNEIVSGDKSSDGAGNIETAGSLDIYSFLAQPGQSIYLEEKDDRFSGGLYWMLVDESNSIVYRDPFGFGDAGVITLEKGGTYSLIFGDASVINQYLPEGEAIGGMEGAGIGVYSFRLWDVPAPDTFNISIGDEISNGNPSLGAGNIETPGTQDIYKFSAEAGQKIFFQIIDNETTYGVKIFLYDEKDAEVFGSCLGCGQPGYLSLDRGGEYTLLIGSYVKAQQFPPSQADPAMGTYSFKIWNVPAPETFTIAIGDTVSENNPGPGAGTIESPGVRDIYTFTAEKGQKIRLKVLSYKMNEYAGQLINISIVDERDYEVFSGCLGCGVNEVLSLDYGGTYTITVGDKTEPGMGTYSFSIELA